MTASANEPRIERSFYPNGQIEIEVTYVGEHIEGVSRYYHENGVLQREVPVKHSRVHGVVRQWSSDGILLGESVFVDGTGVDRDWYESGILRSEVPTKSGIPHGIQRLWDETGALEAERCLISGRPVSRKKYDELLAGEIGIRGSAPTSQQDRSRRPKADAIRQLKSQFPDAQEVLTWLRSPEPERSLGECGTSDESEEIVAEFLNAGSPEVYVVDILREPDGSENSSYLAAILPDQEAARSTVLELAHEWNQAQGFVTHMDTTLPFVLVALD